jgi:two-component system, OmpR family, response regulator
MMSPALTHLLYVDDDRINTLLFVETCRPEPSMRVATAATADDAIESVRTARPDVLVIDLHMPDTDGFSLLTRLRRVPGLERVPAFLCTAEILEAVQAQALSAGFDGVWSKPVDLAGIRQELARVARLRHVGEPQTS